MFINKKTQVINGDPLYLTFDEVLIEYMKRRDNINFIQVGAFDGSNPDVISDLLEREGTMAIMIEPNPEPFRRLENRYIDYSGVHCLNIAISPTEGESDFYFVPEERQREFSSLVSTLAIDRGRILEFGSDVSTIKVQCRRLNNIIKEFSLDRVDCLHIDAEGLDYQVLRSVDFEKFKPNIIHYEERHIPETERLECEKFLSSLGYNIFIEPHPNDTTAYLPEIFSL